MDEQTNKTSANGEETFDAQKASNDEESNKNNVDANAVSISDTNAHEDSREFDKESMKVDVDSLSDNPIGEIEGENKHKNRRPLIIGIIIAAAVVVAIICIAVFVSSRAEIPDIVGMAPLEASQELENLSDQWELKFDDEDGNALEVTWEDPYAGYEVKSVDPDVGESLSKWNDSQQIAMTIGKSKALLEAEREDREKAIEDYIAVQQRDYGWEEGQITYEDNDDFVVITFTGSSSTFEHILYVYSSFLKQAREEGQVEADTLSAEISIPVIMSSYTNDGYLLDIEVSAREDNGCSSDQISLAAQRVSEINTKAENFALANQESLLSQFYDYVVQMDAVRDVTYEVINAGLTVAIDLESERSSNHSDDLHQNSFDDAWQSNVEYLALYTAENVSIGMINSSGEVENTYTAMFDGYLYDPNS